MKLTGKLDDKTKTFESRLWVSNGTPHSFKLEPGTYTLTETAAPAGYTKADDIVFRVKADDGGANCKSKCGSPTAATLPLPTA